MIQGEGLVTIEQRGEDPGGMPVIGGDLPITEVVAVALGEIDPGGEPPRVMREADPSTELAAAGSLKVAVYLAAARSRDGERPDLDDAARVLGALAEQSVCHVVLLSSAAVYSPSHRHAGHLSEERLSPGRHPNPIARRWLELERLATGLLEPDRLTVLRPTFVPLPGASDYVSRLLSGGLAVKPPGYDPSLQILSPDDLGQAVRLAVAQRPGGIYNAAPDGVVPLLQALRLAGSRRLVVPLWLQRLVRGPRAGAGRGASRDQVEYIRYPWTVSSRKLRDELGFAPRDSSAAAVVKLRRAVRGEGPADTKVELEFDPFGMDRGYIDRYGRWLLRYVHDAYWRVELDGLEHVPESGRGVLVGLHRGFMPYDGVMTMHALARRRGRYLRFLIHPTLVKFPFLANFMTKLGGIHACRENADWVLRREGLVGVYPEGIRGAFSYYRDAYQLKKFGRDEFVRMALRNSAPIIPFVTVGSAEIFPILAKIRWPWWIRYSEWPCLPITPTFPLLPLPLPSKWHTRFLEPLAFHESHPPEAADDPATVRAISREVQTRIRTTLEEMRRRRKRIFWGSIFEEQQG